MSTWSAAVRRAQQRGSTHVPSGSTLSPCVQNVGTPKCANMLMPPSRKSSCRGVGTGKGTSGASAPCVATPMARRVSRAEARQWLEGPNSLMHNSKEAEEERCTRRAAGEPPSNAPHEHSPRPPRSPPVAPEPSI